MATTVTTTHVTGASASHAAPADHVPGTMDIRAHQRSFDGFIRFLTWNAVGISVVLVFLALANV